MRTHQRTRAAGQAVTAPAGWRGVHARLVSGRKGLTFGGKNPFHPETRWKRRFHEKTRGNSETALLAVAIRPRALHRTAIAQARRGVLRTSACRVLVVKLRPPKHDARVESYSRFVCSGNASFRGCGKLSSR